jgi:MFS-type transporter involved in bile tolerance (Atg22 family)
MQDLRGWSAIDMALAFLPAGLIVASFSPRIGGLVDRVGTTPPIVGGLLSLTIAYTLFLNVGADSDYLGAMLPTFLFAGVGFALCFGPLNLAATNGVADDEQGLASGLVQTSFQVGGAVALAIVTAVIDAGVSASSAPAGSDAALLDGFHLGLAISVGVALIGLAVTASPALARLSPRIPAFAGRSQG